MNQPEPVGRFSWRPAAANLKYTRRLLDLARQRGIAVYWIMPTISPAQQALRLRLGMDVDFEAFVRQMQAEFPEFVVLDVRRAAGIERFSATPATSTAAACAALSTALAETIAAHPHPGDWLALSPRIASPEADAVEDIAALCIAVGLTPGRAVR